SGQFRWSIHLGATGNEFVKSINIDSSGRLLVAGSFEDPMDFDPDTSTAMLYATGFNSVFMACYDTSGNYQWANVIGGNYGVYANDMAVSPSGEIFLLGTFRGTADFDPSGSSALYFSSFPALYVGRYDSDGNYISVMRLIDTIVGTSIDIDLSSAVYITGYFTGAADFDPSPSNAVNFNTSATISDLFIAKYTAAGNYVWARQIGAAGPEEGAAIQSDALGNLYVCGWFNGTVDFDPGPGVQNITSLADDAFVSRFDTAGSLIWINTMGSTGHDYLRSLDLTPLGTLCAAGSFYAICDVDPSSNTVNLNAPGYAMFIVGYDTATGNYQWSAAPENSMESIPTEVSVSRTGSIHLAGYYSQDVDFDPGVGVALAVGYPFNQDMFAVKYTLNSVSGIDDELSAASIESYPNPSTGHVSIDLDQQSEEVTVLVYDAEGKCISKAMYRNTARIELDIAGAAGVYFVSIQPENGVARQVKVIKTQ
ncbi:MAG TPA: T9SS type A sorting domain-containing protein, partial [Bacteroidia bacterium]|nr:T9SS type A sorting domain-containing protein [Bacteroidia bacterium]